MWKRLVRRPTCEIYIKLSYVDEEWNRPKGKPGYSKTRFMS